MARIAIDDYAKEFNEWYDSTGLNLSAKEKNNIRSRYRTRWNYTHKRGSYKSFEDIVDYEYADMIQAKRVNSIKAKRKEIPSHCPIYLTRKYDSLFQSFIGNLPQDTFDDDLLESFNFWKEHMSKKEASKFAAIDVLYSYHYIGPEMSKILQYKNTLNIGDMQFLTRGE